MAEAEHEPRSYETTVTLSTGTTLDIREPADEVVSRFDTARTRADAALLTLTTSAGHPIHLVAGHIVAIAPRPPDPERPDPAAESPSVEMLEGLTRTPTP